MFLISWKQQLLLAFLVLAKVQSEQFRWSCDLSPEPVIKLKWSSEQRTYVILNDTTVEGDDEEDGRDQGRHLFFAKEDEPTIHRHSQLRRAPLSFPEASRMHHSDDYDKALSVARRTQQSGNTTSEPSSPLEQQVEEVEEDNEVILVRFCPCWDPSGTQDRQFFCPLSRTHCGILGGYGWNDNAHTPRYEDPGCLDISRNLDFARNIWPVVTCWYLAVLLCLLLTRPGKHAFGCCISCCCPIWNYWSINRILREDTSRHHGILIRRESTADEFLDTERFTVELGPVPTSNNNSNSNTDGENNSPTELMLRTTIYHHDRDKAGCKHRIINNGTEAPQIQKEKRDSKLPKNLNNKHLNEDNEDSSVSSNSTANVYCTICHADIEDGDRVGSLPCHHLMHVECLKTWIVRRNVCPLCLSENIATRRQTHGRSTTVGAGANNTANTLSPPRDIPELVE